MNFSFQSGRVPPLCSLSKSWLRIGRCSPRLSSLSGSYEVQPGVTADACEHSPEIPFPRATSHLHHLRHRRNHSDSRLAVAYLSRHPSAACPLPRGRGARRRWPRSALRPVSKATLRVSGFRYSSTSLQILISAFICFRGTTAPN